MDSPARTAFRLLIATGFGLLLASAFAIDSGELSTTPSAIWIIPLLSLAAFSFAIAIAGGVAPFDSLFPLETGSQMQERLEGEFELDLKDAGVNDAWAKLEAEVLSEMIGESE